MGAHKRKSRRNRGHHCVLSVLVSLALLFQQNPRIKANGSRSSKSTEATTPTQSSIE
jgi:hypothetical protein